MSEDAGKLRSSATWGWTTRVNVLVAAILGAFAMRAPRGPHLVGHDAFGVLAFFVALASAYGTFVACREDLERYVPPGQERRPDHHGTTAWVYYMGGVLSLYIALASIFVPMIAFLIPIVLVAQVFFFGIGWVLSLRGLVSDARRGRAALGVIFPAVALVMARVALSPILDPARERDAIRSCYANQKTIVGALEMYQIDRKTKVAALDEAVFQHLVSGGYLQAIPRDPDTISDEPWKQYRLVPDGNGITCEAHGSIQ